MGVPGLAATLFHKYKHTLLVRPFAFTNDITNFNSLFIDANCLIHPVCQKVYSENKDLLKTNLEKLEQKMIAAIIEYLDMLYTLVKPTDLFYIAVDGVAPYAKIKHQKLRRFKSVKEHEIKENIARKHQVEYIKPWNNSAITPGTTFMKKLNLDLINYLNKLGEKNKNLEIIYSSYSCPSEGEHKILQYIRKNRELIKDTNKVIYGLDADLIYLSLATNQDNIYLLRETNQLNYQVKEGFSMVDIDCMKDCILKEIKDSNFKTDSIKKDRFIKDYIFMGFLLGNDFLPPIPSVNFRYNRDPYNGHNILLDCYKKIFNGKYLIKEDLTINLIVFKKLLEELSKLEEQYFINTSAIKKYYIESGTNDPYENEIYNLENLYFKIIDPIQLGIKDIKEAKPLYYDYYKIDINKSIEKYIDGLHWVIKYYFQDCPDWKWYYPYENSPFISDIYEYVNNNKINSKEIIDKFTSNSSFLTPLQQLLIVLPPKSNYLLPYKYRLLMNNELKQYYPLRVELDFVMKNKFWQSNPRIEMIDPDIIIEATDKIYLNFDEKNRNKIRDIYVVNKK